MTKIQLYTYITGLGKCKVRYLSTNLSFKTTDNPNNWCNPSTVPVFVIGCRRIKFTPLEKGL